MALGDRMNGILEQLNIGTSNPSDAGTMAPGAYMNTQPAPPMRQMAPVVDAPMAQPVAAPIGQPQAAPQYAGFGDGGVDPQKAEMAAKVVDQVKANPQVAQDPSFMDKVRGFFGSEENMLRLAMGFNTMRLAPDAQLASHLSGRLKTIGETKRAEQSTNKTLAYLDSINPELANMVRGGLPIKDALAMMQGTTKVVGDSLVRYNPTTQDTTVLYSGKGADDDATTAFKTLQSRAEAGGLEPGTPEYKEFMMRGGANQGLAIQFDDSGRVTGISQGGAKVKAPTEGQGKAFMFSTRMANSQGIINDFQVEGLDLVNYLASATPSLIGNFLKSDDYKKYEQAKQDFINAQLRFESGAAIGPDEFANADRQYFPVPGDTREVMEQKQRNRDIAIQTMKSLSGSDSAARSREVRVALFGPEAAMWPEVGTILEGKRYIGGDPDIGTNWRYQ